MRKEDWTYKKLGEVATFSRGLTFAKGDVADSSSKKVLRSNNIDLSSHSLIFDDVTCLNEDFVIPDEKKLHKGDIFICMSNGSTQHLGKVAFVEDDLDYAFGGFMGAIHPNAKEVYPKYAFYSCRSTEYRKFLTSIFNGININNLKWSELSNFPIPILPLSTQSRIVSELDLLQSIIDKQKTQLKELDNLAQAIFYDMFGDPVENEKGWEVKKFGEVASFKNGLNFSPNENGEMYYIIGVSDFQAKSEINCNENLTIIHLNDAINKEYLLQNDDILFVRSNGNKQLIARNILVKTNNLNVTFSGFCIRARITRNDVSAFFINSLLKLPTSHEALTLKGRGCNISNLNQTTLNDYEIILPPLPLQQSFAQKVESIERQKELINQSIREAQTLFDSRMEYYFGE